MALASGDISAYFVIKHSWKGKYKRVFILNESEIRTLNPTNLEITNKWPIENVTEISVNPQVSNEFIFTFKKQRSSDSMRFSCDYRSSLVIEANWLMCKSIGDAFPEFDSYKLTWNSGEERRVRLQVTSWAVQSIASVLGKNVISIYRLDDIDRIDVSSKENLVRLVLKPFERSHTFRISPCDRLTAFVATVKQSISRELALSANIVRTDELGRLDLRFGPFCGRAESQASLSEFSVYKQKIKQRLLCLSTTCLLERDPRTYAITSMIPYAFIHSLHRSPIDIREFRIITMCTSSSSPHSADILSKRTYASSDRDNLLVALLDSIRASGNTNTFVHSHNYERHQRWAPLGQPISPEIEEIQLRLLLASNNAASAEDYTQDQLRFVSNVNHGGLAFTQNNYFSENRDRLITSALSALVNNDERDGTPVYLELKFLAIRRLLCCQAGFECFSSMPAFRERLGRSVSRAIKSNDSAAAYAAIEALNVLMQPSAVSSESPNEIGPDSNNASANDLIREQNNKKFILHSIRFLESLLSRLYECVQTGESSLVVCSLLDFFTFALCAPFSETTDGAQFEQILNLVCCGRANAPSLFYHLVDHPSLTVRKGAALILRALIEETKGDSRKKLISLALSEGALLSHLSTALYGPASITSTAGGDRAFVRKLSRSLLDLWTTDGVIGDTYVLLKRIFPAGLLRTLTSPEKVNNPRDFVEDCCCLENSSINDDITAQQMKRDNLLVAGRQNENAALRGLMFIERHVNRALNHWKLRVNLKQDNAFSGSGLVVLRRKRPRPADAFTLNWLLFFHSFYQDHVKPDLIWDFKTRRELRDRLSSEYNEFVQSRSLCPTGISIAWNSDEFAVKYECLSDEVKIGSYYLRLLIDKSSNLIESDFIEPVQFFNQLYHKFLLSEPKSSMRRMCSKALGLVYAKCHEQINWFSDVAFIINLIDKGSNRDRIERDYLVDFCHSLSLNQQSASDLVYNRGINVLLNLLPLSHLHSDRATFAAPILESAMIEKAPSADEDDAQNPEWYVQNKGIRSGPFSGSKLIKMFQQKNSGEISAKTQIWAAGMEAWRPFDRVAQFYWNAIVDDSDRLKTETDLTITILLTLIKICRYFPSRKNGAVVRPLPRIMSLLSEPMSLATLAQLTLTFEPTIVENVATLLSLVIRDNPCVSRLYSTGIFFFFLMYQGSNLKPISTFLHATHLKQAFRSTDASGELTGRSILAPLLPDAMIFYLENYGPLKFSEAFLSECRTPEIVWDSSLRRHLISKIALHLYDYTPRLKSNIYAPYQYCPLPKIEYPPPLKDELFCHQFYLRKLCQNPEWPISDPVQLLKDCLKRWKEELSIEGSSLSVSEARTILEMQSEDGDDLSSIRRSYFRLAQKYHPDKNPSGREHFEKVNKAYDLLVQLREGSGAVVGPSKKTLVLLMEAQSYVYRRFSRVMQPFCYAGYGPLIETIERFKNDEGNLIDVSDDDDNDDSVIPAALDLCVATVSCSALNAEAFRSADKAIPLLRECYTRAVDILGIEPNENDPNVRICVNFARFWAVAGRFQRCRNDLVSADSDDDDSIIITLPSELCHSLKIAINTHLSVLAMHTLEACDALTDRPEQSGKRVPDRVNILLLNEFVKSGLPLQLLRTFFNYDLTMDDASQNQDDEDTTVGVVSGKQLALNKIAILAAKIIGRFLWWINGCLPEHMSRMTTDPDTIIEFLRLFHSNTYSPLLLWDNKCRTELKNLLEACKPPFEISRSPGSDEQTPFNIFSSDFKYSLHEDEPVLAGVYLRHYIQNPDQVQTTIEPELFLGLLKEDENSDVEIDIRLKSLLTLCGRYEPHASALNEHMDKFVCFLDKNAGLTAQTLLALCSYESCVNILTKAPNGNTKDSTSLLCSSLLHTLAYTEDPGIHLEGQFVFYRGGVGIRNFDKYQLVPRSVLTILSARPYFVKQLFEKRGHIAILSLFISDNSSTQTNNNKLLELSERKSAAQLLSRICSDSLSGRRARLQLELFLPDLILDKLSDPEVACALYMNDYNNPELIWNRRTRLRVSETVHKFVEDLESSSFPSDPIYLDSSEEAKDDCQVAGVYLNAFLATPGWVVRNPKKFATELLERWIRSVNTITSLPKGSHPSQIHQNLQLLTDCLLSLFGTGQDLSSSSIQPATQQVYALLMDSTVPATGAVPFICSALVHLDDAVAACALKLVCVLVESEPCFRQMTDINSSVGGQSPLARSLLTQIDRRPDLLPLVASLLATTMMNTKREFSLNQQKLL